MKETIKIGDQIVYHGGFGDALPSISRIIQMEVTDYAREKYGQERTEVSLELVEDNRVCITLENGHWCYSEQVDIELTQKLWELEDTKTEDLPTEMDVNCPLGGYIQQRLDEELEAV